MFLLDMLISSLLGPDAKQPALTNKQTYKSMLGPNYFNNEGLLLGLIGCPNQLPRRKVRVAHPTTTLIEGLLAVPHLATNKHSYEEWG
jgi:hypothetical protein